MVVSMIIDRGVMEGALDVVFRLGGLMLLITVFGASCAAMRCVMASKVSQQFGADLRLDMFAKINRFSFAALGRRETAGLITRMTNDTSQLMSFTNSMMRVFMRSPILLFGAITMTFLLNPRLAMILLVIVPLIAILMYISMRVGFPLFTKMQEALDRNNAVLREYLSGVRVVKAYNTFDQEIGRFDVSNTDLANTSIKAMRVIGVFFPVISFAVNIAVVATLWLARGWVADSQMNVGQVVAFLNYVMQITMSLRMIFNVYQMFIRAKASANRVSDIMAEEDAEVDGRDAAGRNAIDGSHDVADWNAIEDRRGSVGGNATDNSRSAAEESAIDNSQGAAEGNTAENSRCVAYRNAMHSYAETPKNKPAVAFTGVTFSYPENTGEQPGRQPTSPSKDAAGTARQPSNPVTESEPVLRDVSFSLPSDEIMGIIGPTGAGKTSLVQLIPAFYLPQQGSVQVNGVSTEYANINALRASIAYVSQQNTLFYGTIADNIRMGKANATVEEVQAAAKAAMAHEFIEACPEGYDTIVSQKGVNLSGGQKQRLGIARALVRKAQILILDDCVSAVDVETEAAILQAIGNLDPSPTIVMITQRISSVMNLRHILVMDAGKAAGYGSHDYLMENCRVYQEIYHSQLI